jgi:hypothetical protein
MKIKKIPGIMGFAILVITSLLLTGCPQQIDSSYGVKVTSEGDGGAFALYQDKPGGSLYIQKTSAEGKLLWGEKGVLLGDGDGKAYSYSMLNIISDGSGGAIIAWPNLSEKQFRPTTYLARIDADGKLLWQRGFIYFDQIVSDGAGGAIIAFDDNIVAGNITGNDEQDLLLVRLDAKGDYPWSLQGVTVPRGKYQDSTLQMTPDGSGGVIIVWEEIYRPSDAKPGENVNTNHIFSQRINSKGKLEWGDNILVYTTPKNTYAETPQIVGDGSGGAIIVWQQIYSGRVEGGSPEAEMMDIFAQKIDAAGNMLWQANGLPLEINKNAAGAFPVNPQATSDGNGGAIIVWRDRRDAVSLFAQKVNDDGTLSWQAGGVKVASTSLNPRPMITADGAGGAIVSYSFEEDGKMLNVQKLDSSGKTIWPENGVTVVKDGFGGYFIVPDGQGGLITGWGIGKKANIQRLSPEGRLLWKEDGIGLNP